MSIVSGGQTGVDRAALDAAMAAGADCWGWCPAGRLAEDGEIERRYPLRETESAQPGQRTRQNIEDSDGTLVLDYPVSGPGTALTIEYAKTRGKPLLVIDASSISYTEAVPSVLDFIASENLNCINVAGPRASEAPEAYAYTQQLISQVLRQVSIES